MSSFDTFSDGHVHGRLAGGVIPKLSALGHLGAWRGATDRHPWSGGHCTEVTAGRKSQHTTRPYLPFELQN